MKTRCNNPNSSNYARYGARGIKVCDEWSNSAAKFADWAYANGYSDELSIDRIDNDGDYEPSNCRWVTPHQQNLNKSSNHLVTSNPNSCIWKQYLLSFSHQGQRYSAATDQCLPMGTSTSTLRAVRRS